MHQLFSHRDLCEILHAGAEIIHNPHPGLCLIYVFFLMRHLCLIFCLNVKKKKKHFLSAKATVFALYADKTHKSTSLN